MVDDGGSTGDEAITHTMHRLQVELVVGLDRNEAHVLPIDSFGDRFRIEEVVLVRLQLRLYELARDESHVVSLAAQGCADEMCS